MSSQDSFDKNLVALVATVAVFLLFLAVYVVPRSATLRETRTSIESLQTVRQEVAVLLPEVVRTVPTTPLPEPDVRTWVANNSLAGI